MNDLGPDTENPRNHILPRNSILGNSKTSWDNRGWGILIVLGWVASSIILEVDANRTVECAHCEAKGTCRAGVEARSCDQCCAVAFAHLEGGDRQQPKLVSCSKCSGSGRQNLSNGQSLTFLYEEEEADARRRINYHRYVVAILAIVAGLVIAIAGLIAEIWLDGYNNEHYLIATLPVASAIISGALGAIVGGPHVMSTRPSPGNVGGPSIPQSQSG